MKLKVLIFLTASLLLSTSFTYSQNNNQLKTNNANVEQFDPARDAAKDLQNAIGAAEKTNKRIILDVGGEWCIWCHRLDSMFVKNPNLSNFRDKNFIYVKINFSKENKNEKFLSQFPEIPGYPHWFVLDSNGKVLKSESSEEFESGKGHSPEKVMAFLKKWALKKKQS